MLASGLPVVCHGTSHESLVVSKFTHKPLVECAYQENKSDKLDIPCYYSANCNTIQIWS